MNNQSNFELRFNGIERLFGENAINIFKEARVLVIGIGGVGSWACESLIRSGLGNLTIVDMDDICITNTNRQVHALKSSIGELKVHAMKKRLLEINPEAEIEVIEDFFSKDNAESILNNDFDYIIDAFDHKNSKCFLINEAYTKKLPLITTGGAGGKMDPSMIEVVDLNETYNDRLLAVIKKVLRQEFNFPRGKKKFKIPCVFSREIPKYPQDDGSVSAIKNTKEGKKLDCYNGFGSASFLTGSMGLACAHRVLKDIYERKS